MSHFNTLSQLVFLGNPLWQWLLALAIGMAVGVSLSILHHVLHGRAAALAARTSSRADDVVVSVLSQTRRWFIVLVGAFVASQQLERAERVDRVLDAVVTIGTAIQLMIWGNAGLGRFFDYYQKKAIARDPGASTSVKALSFGAKLLFGSLLLLLALDNLGVNVTAMVAGLGVGGIAIALAVQNILGDLFASVSIIADRPFVVGDFIVLDDFMGTVEHIGIKTTRLRSLGGEQIILANNDLLKSRVRNFKRMYERRVVFAFGLTYETTPDQIRWVAAFLRELIGKTDKVRLERAHFFKFGDSSLDFEVAYWVQSPEYGVYMDIQESINLQLMEALAERQIEFAYPTRTLKIESVLAPPDDTASANSQGPDRQAHTSSRAGNAARSAETLPALSATPSKQH